MELWVLMVSPRVAEQAVQGVHGGLGNGLVPALEDISHPPVPVLTWLLSRECRLRSLAKQLQTQWRQFDII
jgi:hypothetical protein